jgi:glycosyltransferase involved in cell wall biosynthesis
MRDRPPASMRARVSVVIPTHNRRALLRQALDALAEQTFPVSELEVVVVADGCVDDTASMLASYAPPYRLKVLHQTASGAPEARNAGAKAATAPILIFLDDDIQPSRTFVAAHAAAHAIHPGSVVLGPYPPAPVASPSFFRLLMRGWWTAHFDALAEPGHRFSYRDLLTGNLSLAAELWQRLGGLDVRFRNSGEDHELGVRLMQAGVPFVYEPDAAGWHHEHETMSLQGACRRAYEEGRMDALMGDLHPSIRRSLPLTQPRPRTAWARGRAIFLLGRGADVLATAARLIMPALDRAGARGPYRMLFRRLRGYWYARGVSNHFRRFRDWEAYVRDAADPPSVEASLDLRKGLRHAEAELDRLRPDSVELRYGPHPLGRLAYQPGAEPWRGAHLRPCLAGELRACYLRALALEGEIIVGEPAQLERLAAGVEAATRARQPVGFDIWAEQREQWDRLGHAT